MTRSMTAFASAEIISGHLRIVCELRSVNHRYCDINLKIPERFRFAEDDLHTVINKNIKRGKIECSLNYKTQHNEQAFSVNSQAVRQLLLTTREIANLMDTKAAFTALDVLAFPGIQQEAELDRETLSTDLNTLIQQALNTLIDNRQREGTELHNLVAERNHKIQHLAEQGEQRIPHVLVKQREKILDRINELVQNPDKDRIEQELVLLTQKMDVAEELDRLKTHVEEVNRVLNQREPIGRRLDFLMQEMNREANTLGSKSTDKEMTRIAIELKVLIEQMREQIQNIE